MCTATNPPISCSLPQTKPRREIFTNLYWEILAQEERVINFPFQINLWLGKFGIPRVVSSWFGPAINLINKLQSPTQSSSFLPFHWLDFLMVQLPQRSFYSWSFVNCHLRAQIIHMMTLLIYQHGNLISIVILIYPPGVQRRTSDRKTRLRCLELKVWIVWVPGV